MECLAVVALVLAFIGLCTVMGLVCVLVGRLLDWWRRRRRLMKERTHVPIAVYWDALYCSRCGAVLPVIVQKKTKLEQWTAKCPECCRKRSIPANTGEVSDAQA